MMNRDLARFRLSADLTRDPGILILAYPYARTWRELAKESVADAWSRVGKEGPSAAYIHIPFCRRKCTFCDFLAYYGRPELEIDQYLDLLTEEIRQVGSMAGEIRLATVHLGGGTPSLLSHKQLPNLLDAIGVNFCLAPDAQITMEVFPDEYVSRNQLAEWKIGGVNRLSFGFQFFDDQLKRTLNRTDFAKDNLRLFSEARDVGYDDVNVDLMCGLPSQSFRSWRETIRQTVKLSPEHVCIFPVSVRHPGIPLFKKQNSLPSYDRTRRMYDEAVDSLLGAGYRRTTRHNFVRPESDYKYEQMIAQLRPLIGLGANSISFAHNCIYRNHSDLAEYASSVRSGKLPVRSGHLFDATELPHNYAVRQIEYLSLDGEDFKGKFARTLRTAFSKEIDLLEEFGLAHVVGEDLRLTEDGIYFTSAVKRVFFHQSAWHRLAAMEPNDFKIERGLLPVVNMDPRSGEYRGQSVPTITDR